MKIVGTIVNSKLKLIGLVLKGKPKELGLGVNKDWFVSPFSLKESKEYIKNGKCENFTLDNKGNIASLGTKKLNQLPMYDEKGNIKRINLKIQKVLNHSNGDLFGCQVLFTDIDNDNKIKEKELDLPLDAIVYLSSYCPLDNFIVGVRNNKPYLAGKNNTIISELPIVVIDDKKSVGDSKLSDDVIKSKPNALIEKDAVDSETLICDNSIIYENRNNNVEKLNSIYIPVPLDTSFISFLQKGSKTSKSIDVFEKLKNVAEKGEKKKIYILYDTFNDDFFLEYDLDNILSDKSSDKVEKLVLDGLTSFFMTRDLLEPAKRYFKDYYRIFYGDLTRLENFRKQVKTYPVLTSELGDYNDPLLMSDCNYIFNVQVKQKDFDKHSILDETYMYTLSSIFMDIEDSKNTRIKRLNEKAIKHCFFGSIRRYERFDKLLEMFQKFAEKTNSEIVLINVNNLSLYTGGNFFNYLGMALAFYLCQKRGIKYLSNNWGLEAYDCFKDIIKDIPGNLELKYNNSDFKLELTKDFVKKYQERLCNYQSLVKN